MYTKENNLLYLTIYDYKMEILNKNMKINLIMIDNKVDFSI